MLTIKRPYNPKTLTWQYILHVFFKCIIVFILFNVNLSVEIN